MIRIVPVNRSGISSVIEYDTFEEKRAILTLLGATETATIKLGKVRNYNMFGGDYIESYGDMVHYLNDKGHEVAHTMMDLTDCPHKLAMFETPRVWAEEIKRGHLIGKVLKPENDIYLEVAPEVQKI
jgi:hypothetical protein